MKTFRLDNFWGGWFVGNFEPSIVDSPGFEVCIKRFHAGDTEPLHYQIEAWEITAVVSGSCVVGGHHLKEDDLILIEPGEAADFQAKTDCVVVAVKSPSLPEDKHLGSRS